MRLAMRTSVAFLCLALLPVGIGVVWFACVRAERPTSQDSFAREMLGHVRRLDGASVPGRIVFLGGSTFQALDHAAVTANGLNLSIGGELLAELVERSSTYRSLLSAKGVIVNSGFNDVARFCRLPAVAALGELRARVPTPTPLFFVGVQRPSTARQESMCSGEVGALVSRLNEALAEQCARLLNCSFVPHPTAEAEDGASLDQLLSSDGIHLSPQGYARLTKALRDRLSVAAAP